MAPPDNPNTTNVKSKLKLHYLKEKNKNLTELLSPFIYSQCRGNCRNWRFCSLLLLLFKVLDLLLKGSKISFLFEFNICLLAATLLVMCVPWSRIADNWVLLTPVTDRLTDNKMKCRFNRISCLPIEEGQISVNSGR